MSTSAPNHPPFPLPLGKVTHTLRWSHAAAYWLSKLPRPARFEDLRDPAKHDGFICDHVWAMLPDRVREREFTTPAALLEPLREHPAELADTLWKFVLFQAYGFDVDKVVVESEGTQPPLAKPDDSGEATSPKEAGEAAGESGTKP